jgi:hypothetical protein
VGLNLPVVLGDPFHFENDASFWHEAEYGWIAKDASPKVGCLIQTGPSRATVPSRLRLSKADRAVMAVTMKRISTGDGSALLVRAPNRKIIFGIAQGMSSRADTW